MFLIWFLKGIITLVILVFMIPYYLIKFIVKFVQITLTRRAAEKSSYVA